MADIECPSCGTQLRNVQPGPDGHIRCLNCGKRFAAGAPSSSPSAPDASLPPGEEPAAGHYGLVVIFAWLFLVATFVLMIPTYRYFAEAWRGLKFEYYFLDDLGATLYGITALAGLPLLGLCVLNAMKRFETLDGHAVRLAWRMGPRSDSPGEAPGSNLPYILPFSAAGGLFIFLPAMLALQEWSPSTVDLLVPFLLAGLLLVFLGLAMGEVRRFLWRMEQTACVLLRPDETYGPPAEPLLARAVPWLAVAVMPLNLAGLYVYMLRAHFTTRWQFAMWLAFGVCLLGGPYTLRRIGLQAREVLALWGEAAQRRGAHTVPHRYWPLEGMALTGYSLFLHVTLFCCLMILVMFVLPDTSNLYYRWERTGMLLSIFGGLAATCFALFLAGSLGFLAGYTRVARAWADRAAANPAAALPMPGRRWAIWESTWLIPWLCVANILGLFFDATGSRFYGLQVLFMGAPAWFAWWLFLLCEELRGLTRSMADLEAACTPKALEVEAPTDR